MKRNSLLLFPFFSIMFLYACHSGGSGEAYTIKMRLNKGDTFRQDMQMNMLMNSFGMEMKMKMNSDYSFEVMNSNENEKDLKITYTNMNMSTDMGTLKRINTDSLMNKNYENIIGKSVIIKLSKNNVITDVQGFEDILNSQARDSASTAVLKKIFSKEQLNSTFGMMFNIYPKKPVQVGESWTNESKVKMANLDMKIASKYTLLSVKNGMAEINMDGDVSGTNDVMKITSGVNMQMTGKQKGTVTLRMDNGYLHAGSYKMDMKADMEMMGKKMSMTLKAEYLIKGE